MTKYADRPEDAICEGCWDARPVPELRNFFLCDHYKSSDYGHLVYYRHACQCFSVTDRGDPFFPFAIPAVCRPPGMTPLDEPVTPEQDGLIGQGKPKKPLDFNPVRPLGRVRHWWDRRPRLKEVERLFHPRGRR